MSSKKRRRKKLIKNENVNILFNAVVVLECSFAEFFCDDRLSELKENKEEPHQKRECKHTFQCCCSGTQFAEKICDDRLSSKRRRKKLIIKEDVNTLSMLLLFWYSQFCRKNNSGWQIELKEKKKKKKTTSSRAP